MEDETKNLWDVIIAGLTTILTLLTILLGVHQFNKGELNKVTEASRLAKENDKINFQRQLWIERLGAYRSIAQLTGRLISHEDNDKNFKKDFTEFEAAYWGLMIFVEDQPVANEMQRFQFALGDYAAHRVTGDYLRKRADLLIKACSDSIKTGEVELEKR
jgi:hypothetical protein